MKNGKVLIVCLIGLLMAGGLILAGCDTNTGCKAGGGCSITFGAPGTTATGPSCGGSECDVKDGMTGQAHSTVDCNC